MNTDKIYLVYEQVSDQYGTSKMVKAFNSRESAEKFQRTLRNRSYIDAVTLNS